MSDDKKLKGVFGSGLLMGLADAVPGVSGGTIALILGIYDKLLNFLSVCVSFIKEGFPKESRTNFLEALNFLLPLALGMFLSYYLVTKILVGSDSSPGLLMEKDTAPYIYSFFFGLVFISIREPWKFVSNPSTNNYFLVLLGSTLVFVYTRYPIESTSNIFLVISGVFALTAMLLPGVSGALVLLTLGLYDEIVGYVHNMDFVPLIYFFLGGFIALFTFVPFMNRMLNDHREFTMSILTGLMIGSLVTLWPWKESYDKGSLPENLPLSQILDDFELLSVFITILTFIIGIFSSYGLKYFEQRLRN
tara:strand:+ start:895 stop:1809 length:915 start_codon:yes stop_codon:yes gene_type:complete